MTNIIQTDSITKIQNSLVTSVTKQVPTLSYTTVTGSEITYEPEKNSTWVVYDIQFTIHSRVSAHVGLYGALVYEDSGSDVAFEYRFTGDAYNDGGYLIRYKFLIPSYTGERTWKFMSKYHYCANWSQALHEYKEVNKYFPIKPICSIM